MIKSAYEMLKQVQHDSSAVVGVVTNNLFPVPFLFHFSFRLVPFLFGFWRHRNNGTRNILRLAEAR
jgi:hypothetical protein